jgi:hypothetical protein
MGEWIYRYTFSWPRHHLEASGQLHAPAALPPKKEPPGSHRRGGWVGPRAGLDNVEKGKFLTPPGLELRSLLVQPIANVQWIKHRSNFTLPVRLVCEVSSASAWLGRFGRGVWAVNGAVMTSKKYIIRMSCDWTERNDAVRIVMKQITTAVRCFNIHGRH